MDAFGRTHGAKRRAPVEDPIHATDPANKRYVDAHSIPRTKDDDYDMQGRRLTNVKAPQLQTDAATKTYVDSYRLARTRGGDYSAAKKRITNLHDPVDEQDACTKAYVHKQALLKTKEGNYDMKGKRVQRVAAPTESNDATNKDYVDTKVATLSSRIRELQKAPSVYTLQLMSKPSPDKIQRTYTLLSGLREHTFRYNGTMKVIHHVPDTSHLSIRVNGEQIPHSEYSIKPNDKLSFHLNLSVDEVRAGRHINEFPLYVELEMAIVTA